jgi:hypothetical protein
MQGSTANQPSTGPIEIHPLRSHGAGIQNFSGHTSWIHLNGYNEVDVRNRAQGF